MRQMVEILYARIAQLVEQRIENPRVGGSSPPPGTTFSLMKSLFALGFLAFRRLSQPRCRYG